MFKIRRASSRGNAQSDWLESSHTFSFANYFDANFIHFRSLRVINEDKVKPRKGFALHRHENMEIITLVLKGELEHRDSLGNQGIIRAGEVQRMAAGTGIEHSEYNPHATEQLHLFQIWILPQKKGLRPEYAQKSFAKEWNETPLTKAVSGQFSEEVLRSPEPIELFLGNGVPGRPLEYSIGSSRHVWLQIVEGQALMDEENLFSSDGVSFSEEDKLSLEFLKPTRFFLIDLP